MNENDLVYIDDYGLRGANFYWHKYDVKGMTKEDILSVGLTSDRVQVHRDIIDALVVIDQEIFDLLGYRIYIKEGYRSSALYDLIYEKRVEKFGKEETDKLLNMQDKPHANGTTVDLALWDAEQDTEIYMRYGDDGLDALFIDFYKDRKDEEGKRYQYLQETLIGIMMKYGFCLGAKREYFHFDYRPELEPNYP